MKPRRLALHKSHDIAGTQPREPDGSTTETIVKKIADEGHNVTQPDLIDLLLADYKKPEDLIGEWPEASYNGILKQLTKAIVERARGSPRLATGLGPLQAELAVHLGHDKHEAFPNESGNTRYSISPSLMK